MTPIIELTIREVRGALPHVWVLAQVLAAIAALAYLWLRTRAREKLVVCLVLALPAGALGALALGFVYRLLDRLAGRGADVVGVASYGALLGVSVAFAALVRRRGLPVLASLDALAPALALLVGVGRLGCLFGGCDGGQISTSALAVRFPAGTAVFREHVARGLVLPTDRWSLSVHPTQLYEALLALALACLADWLRRRTRLPPGFGFGAVALGYAVSRTAVDSLRSSASNAAYGMVTSLVAVIGLIVLLRPRAPRSVQA
jgi:phosphatidylglycerol:prolipoprotein diacylglycerol transferase